VWTSPCTAFPAGSSGRTRRSADQVPTSSQPKSPGITRTRRLRLLRDAATRLMLRNEARVATIATEKGRAIKLSLADARLTLSAISPDAGRALEELDVQYAGEALEIGFNARYILDMNSQIEGDEVEFAMADAGSPTLVRDPKDSSTLYVLMPMRV